MKVNKRIRSIKHALVKISGLAKKESILNAGGAV